ncbi:MAG: glycosyltransferase family 4 protein [Planctomycetes bacterium]|jgi:glycosyltransferase involved in cell wall biosynthesis|nr:glycosyltransferase family 4 protein [Planctomycetota bacterium]
MADRRFKILFATGWLEPCSTTSHALYLARHLGDMGHEVLVATPGGPLLEEFSHRRVECAVEPRLGSPLLPGRGAGALLRLLAERPFRPDLIHVQSPDMVRAGAAFASRAGIPFFLSLYAPPRRRQRLPLPWKFLRGLVAGSQEIRENLVNHHRIPRDLLRVITTGVDADYFRPVGRPRDPRKVTIPVVGMVGRLAPFKGADVFLRAARIVADQGLDVQFLVAGDGPEAGGLRRLAQDLRLESWVTFTAQVHDYRSLLGAIDIFVRPAMREGLALSLLEAMACGKPVVAAGVGNVFGLVRDGENGLLVPRSDVPALALAVSKLVSDPAHAMEIGRRARKVVEELHDVAAKARELTEFYERRLEMG